MQKNFSNTKPHCIVGFSFGTGVSNARIGQEIRSYLHKSGIKLPLLQWEIADCVGNHKEMIITKSIEHEEGRRMYIDSYYVACRAWETMWKNGWKNCLVAGHKDHVNRCVKIMRKLGAEVVGTITTDVYDRRSSQVWTRSPFFFKPYDILATLFI